MAKETYPEMFFVRDLHGHWAKQAQTPFSSFEAAKEHALQKRQDYLDGFGGFAEYAIVKSQLLEIIP